MILIKPSKIYRKKILDFKEEFSNYGENTIYGGELLDKMDFDEWITYVQNNSNPETVSHDWVLTDVFFALEDDTIVGVISFRHKLNDFLKNWGHIGYSVRPSRRRRGIATQMLEEVLAYARNIGLRQIQLSSYSSNIASVKTILNNNGTYVRSFVYLEKEVNIYIIRLNNHDDNIEKNC